MMSDKEKEDEEKKKKTRIEVSPREMERAAYQVIDNDRFFDITKGGTSSGGLMKLPKPEEKKEEPKRKVKR